MVMTITEETTVKDILEAYPGAVVVFEEHGVSVPPEHYVAYPVPAA